MGKNLHGANLQYVCELRQKQMRLLLDEMTKPVFEPVEFDPKTQLDKYSITFRILNTKGYGRGTGSNNITWCSIAWFMNSIQEYLPETVKIRRKETKIKLWRPDVFCDRENRNFADETTDLLDAMVDWLYTMREACEDHLTKNYYANGAFKDLEILKRRYKADWSERTEQSVDADVKADGELNIRIIDA